MSVAPTQPLPADPRRTLLRAALIVFLFSTAIRVGWVSFATVTPVSDFEIYDRIARQWLADGELGLPGERAGRTPTYPAFLAGVYWLTGGEVRAAQFAQALLGGATSGLIVLLAGCALRPRVAFPAGVLHACSPTSLAYAPVLASENVAVPLLVLTLLTLTCWPARAPIRRLLSIAGGACFALLVLTRPAALFFTPALLLLCAWSPLQRQSHVVRCFGFVVALSVVLTPWFARNHRLGLGHMTLSTVGGVNLWMGNNDLATNGGYLAEALLPLGLNERETDVRHKHEAMQWIGQHPTRYADLCRVRFARLVGTTPDGCAATYLWPTPTSDEAAIAAARPDPPKLADTAGNAEIARNAKLLARFRRISAPLVLLAVILSFANWRRFLYVTAPALCYAVGVSLVFFDERFRELWNPLVIIPTTALLADLAWGTDELGRRPAVGGKRLLAAASLALVLLLHATSLTRPLYRLEPQCAPDAPASSSSSSNVTLSGSNA